MDGGVHYSLRLETGRQASLLGKTGLGHVEYEVLWGIEVNMFTRQLTIHEVWERGT